MRQDLSRSIEEYVDIFHIEVMKELGLVDSGSVAVVREGCRCEHIMTSVKPLKGNYKCQIVI